MWWLERNTAQGKFGYLEGGGGGEGGEGEGVRCDQEGQYFGGRCREGEL